MTEIILVPGINGSGPAHWQSLWAAEDATMRPFQPRDWDHPELDDWLGALDAAVAASNALPVLVAHSLGCLLVAFWQARSAHPVAGAFLVAVPDPVGPKFPAAAVSFTAPPGDSFRCPALIVGSSDDPYGTPDYARQRAAQWGCGYLDIGAKGHLNAKSGLGAWPEGRALLTAFIAGLAH